MLSDDRLQQLLRDADALDTFEHGQAVAPLVRRPHSPAAARPMRRLFAAAAVIALLGGVGVVLVNAFTTKPEAPRNLTARPEIPVRSPLTSSTSSLLLAVYQNDAGDLSCVNWSADALKGRTMASLSAEELTRLGLALACDPEAARILVVGLEGPAAALPSSDARAKAVAQCLSNTTPCGSGAFNATTCASAGCIDNGVKVRVESLALK